MFTIGESRAISYADDTEQQAQQEVGNPRRRTFSTETPLQNADKNSSRLETTMTTRNREAERTSLSTAKATSSTQRPKTCEAKGSGKMLQLHCTGSLNHEEKYGRRESSQ